MGAKILKVRLNGNPAGPAKVPLIEALPFSFPELEDTPSSYSGQSGKVCQVKATEDGIEFAVGGGGGAAKVTLAIDETEGRKYGTATEVFTVMDKSFDFIKDSTYLDLASLSVLLQMKTGIGTGTVYVYIDAEGSPRITLTTTSVTYVVKTGTTDISALGDGLHTVHIKGKCSSSTDWVYLRFFHMMGVE